MNIYVVNKSTVVSERAGELAWKVVFADRSKEAGDLGYHDFTPDGRPISYVDAADAKDGGYSIPVTATHEIAEMIADPWVSESFQVSDARFFAKKWFIPKSTGQFDRHKKIDEPLKILPDGYMSVFTPGRGWLQKGPKKGPKKGRRAARLTAGTSETGHRRAK